jgi:hypothetical protein
VTRREPRSADAYDLYLRGWNFANQRTPATSRRAIEYFERATAIEPNYLAVRDVHLIFLTADPKWDPLRQDPRFEALVAKCGFAVAHPR